LQIDMLDYRPSGPFSVFGVRLIPLMSEADSYDMPSFAYTARDNTGAAVTGTLIADSIAEVTRLLRGDGKYPTSIQPAGQAAAVRSPKGARGIKVSREEVIQLATQLSIMVDTGVTLRGA
jgi:type II secretory pathway component PulF